MLCIEATCRPLLRETTTKHAAHRWRRYVDVLRGGRSSESERSCGITPVSHAGPA
jgi:hypothetical protein